MWSGKSANNGAHMDEKLYLKIVSNGINFARRVHGLIYIFVKAMKYLHK
jgi:hypothetical protein